MNEGTINEKNWRRTRIKMDLILPVLFSVIWIVLFFAKFSIAKLCELGENLISAVVIFFQV